MLKSIVKESGVNKDKRAQAAVMKAKGLFMFEITQLPQGRLFSPGCSLVRK